jgi:hypothetical protein
VLELLGLRLAPVAALDGLGKTFVQLIFGLLDCRVGQLVLSQKGSRRYSSMWFLLRIEL